MKNNITPAPQQAQSKKALNNELSSDYTISTNSIADVEIKTQLFTKPGQLTKNISTDENGHIVKNALNCRMAVGEVKTIAITPKSLPKILDNIEFNQALALSNIDYKNGRKITTNGNEHDDIISRTLKHFPFVSGAALILFDVDAGDGYNPENLKQILADITKFIPEFEHAAKIIKPSTSSGIQLKETNDE